MSDMELTLTLSLCTFLLALVTAWVLYNGKGW